jgi:transcriptional regulator GlxA family with amidase domain
MMEISDRLLALQGKIHIADFARQYGITARHLERAFAAQTGTSPKMYARIARFQTALDVKVAAPEMTWLEISHALGYYDQMHLIHDFRKLGGGSPGRILEHLIDMRPEALACRCRDDLS